MKAALLCECTHVRHRRSEVRTVSGERSRTVMKQ